MSIPNDFYTDYNEIIDNLYVGNERSVRDFDPNKMTLVVNCTKNIPSQNNSLKKIRLPVDDTPEESMLLYDYINRTHVLEEIYNCLFSNKCVLVHCRMGIQRSCAVVACYLIKYHRLTPEQAVFFIKKKRPIAFYGNEVNFMETMELIHRDKFSNTYYV